MKKYLFVGVGGSGNKTLRAIKHALGKRLSERGYDGPLPRGWRFLALDLDAQGRGNRLAPPLERDEFVRLAPEDVSFRQYDAALAGHGLEAAAREFATWRPDNHRAPANPWLGAGQYRAVGRVIALNNLSSVVDELDAAFATMQEGSVETELQALAARIDEEGEAASDLAIVVVASIAGGTGAAAFLDVCDVIRARGGAAANQVMAVLYTPDAFGELDPQLAAGTDPNALAAISELTNAVWGRHDVSHSPHLAAAGAGHPGARGPFVTMLVGGGNSEVKFNTSAEVFEAVAGSLSAIVTSASLESEMDSTISGNSAQSQAIPVVPPLLQSGLEKPLSAMGYARLSLGRDRFARYASERLARGTVEHLLSAHHDDAVRSGLKAPDARLAEVVTDGLVRGFLNDCGLNELSTENNQVVDAIQGPDQLRSSAQELAREVFDHARSSQKLPGPAWAERIRTQLLDRERRFRRQREAEIAENLDRWLEDVQPQVVSAVNELVTRQGLPVAAEVVRRATGLVETAVAELAAETTTADHDHREAMQNLYRETSGLREPVGIEHGQLKGLIDRYLRIHLLSADDAAVRRRGVQALTQLRDSFLVPLSRVVTGQANHLAELVSEQVIDDWAGPARVPGRLAESPYEVFLDATSEYPAIFERILRATVGGEGRPDAQAVGRLLRSGPLPLTFDPWIPPSVDDGRQPQPVRFDLAVHPDALLARATEWLHADPAAGVGAYLRQTMSEYLDDPQADPVDRDRRIADFGRRLHEVMRRARPLVEIDPTALRRVHDARGGAATMAISPIPFAVGHPAYQAARDALTEAGIDADAIDGYFREGTAQAVDVSSFLAPSLLPWVFRSLVKRISDAFDRSLVNGEAYADFWRHRRARRLAEAIPLDRAGIEALVRGWFTGLLLGAVDRVPGRSTVRTSRGDSVAIASRRLPFSEQARDELPNILESLPLALISYAQGDDTALDGYQTLLELGGGRPTHGHANLTAVLESFVTTGDTPSGWTPMVEGASAADRRTAIVDALEDTIVDFEQVTQTFQQVRGYTAPDGMFDIADLAIVALEDLRAALGGVVVAGAGRPSLSGA